VTQIFSEEVRKLLFDKGLYLSESQDDLPEGFNSQQTNLWVDELGHLSLRAGFGTAGYYDQGTTNVPRERNEFIRPIELYPPDFPFDYLRRVFNVYQAPTPVGGTPTTYTQFPALIISRWNRTTASATTAYRMHIIKSSAIGSGVNYSINNPGGGGVNQYFGACCQYKDRLYFGYATPGSTLELVGDVKRLSGWSFADADESTLVQSDLPAFGTDPFGGTNGKPIEGMITFRDRIFGWCNDKIYFTEVALVGGYPEDWNFGNNILQVQSVEESCTIHNIIPLRDKMYIFTDRGIYQLYAVGSASGWYLQPVSRDYRVFGRNAVCLVKDAIVFTDRSRIWLYNGDEFRQLGQEIDHEMNQATSATVTPFEDGFIVSCNVMSNAPASISHSFITPVTFTANWWTLESSRHFYFNGTWSELVFYDDESSPRTALALIGGFTNKVTWAKDSEPTSYLVFCDETINDPKPLFFTLFYDRNSLRLDSFDTVDSTVIGELTTGMISHPSSPFQHMDIKYGYMDMMAYLNQIDDVYVQDQGNERTQDNNGVPNSLNETWDSNHLLKFDGPRKVRKFAIHITVDSFNENTATVDEVQPRSLFRLRELAVMQHAEQRDLVDKIPS
jgi:hypothetical protein